MVFFIVSIIGTRIIDNIANIFRNDNPVANNIIMT